MTADKDGAQTLVTGLYERLLDQDLNTALQAHPELVSIFRKLDDEEAPHLYAQFLMQLTQQALRGLQREHRLDLVNRLIELLSAQDNQGYLQRHELLAAEKAILTEVKENKLARDFARPVSPFTTSALLTGSRNDPPLEHELRAEMDSADRVDILVSFVKWSGLRLLQPAFEELAQRGVPVRLITTSYMGASDPEAVLWLSRQPGVSVRVSYDTSRTRLHAKAYHFVRRTGFSTAYIGSANMSNAAMTSGLEWNLKVTAQDLPHILERFQGEFETYWNSPEFEPFEEDSLQELQQAIKTARQGDQQEGPRFFLDLKPYPFQERVLEALLAARQLGRMRNLVVAATGTGKTLMAAFDYQRFCRQQNERPKLLFVAHRKEILEQAQDAFRMVLRDANFGQLFIAGNRPDAWQHVFASIQSLNSQRPWDSLGAGFYRFVIIDEVHHSAAETYRPIIKELQPEILLGLTATPERMDGSSILPDFSGEPAAEIRLPEALEQKLLCPFHYFGVTDPVSLDDGRFWANGKYKIDELEKVYTGDDLQARQRLDAIFRSLQRYQPGFSSGRNVGFCVSVKHAQFMAQAFVQQGLKAATIVGTTEAEERDQVLRQFRNGSINFLFAVDVLSEGVDVPEIDLVMFLRPTESLTVFLQQLGRGLRHAPGKECLTVLDFVGQSHRKYRVERKFAALLTRERLRIDQEVEADFPHLPPGCNIQLERQARQYVLENIQRSLKNLQNFVVEALKTRSEGVPTLKQFLRENDLDPLELLKTKTWSEWKATAGVGPDVTDPDVKHLRKTLRRLSTRSDPHHMHKIIELAEHLKIPEPPPQQSVAEEQALYHYLFWGSKGANVGVASAEESLQKLSQNPATLNDLKEIAEWNLATPTVVTEEIATPAKLPLRLHANYGLSEIKASFGLATVEKPGPMGVGVIHIEQLRTYIHLVTFNKSDRDFEPTTLYKDYPISPRQLHWESNTQTSQESPTGQNYLHFQDRDYTILFFARYNKRTLGETTPFTFLGPAKQLLSYQGNNPIEMIWELQNPMPAQLFEQASSL